MVGRTDVAVGVTLMSAVSNSNATPVVETDTQHAAVGYCYRCYTDL